MCLNTCNKRTLSILIRADNLTSMGIQQGLDFLLFDSMPVDVKLVCYSDYNGLCTLTGVTLMTLALFSF